MADKVITGSVVIQGTFTGTYSASVYIDPAVDPVHTASAFSVAEVLDPDSLDELTEV